jgi:hypothetical protein
MQPTRESNGASGPSSLFGLAPSGVYAAGPVAGATGGLLHHLFTLTLFAEANGAVVFCRPIRRIAPPSR